MSFAALASPPSRNPLRFNSHAPLSTPSTENELPSLLRRIAQTSSSASSHAIADSRAIDVIRQLLEENAVLLRQLNLDEEAELSIAATPLPSAIRNPNEEPSPFDRSQEQRRSSLQAEWTKALQHMAAPYGGESSLSASALLQAEFEAALAQNLALHARLHELVLRNNRQAEKAAVPQSETDAQSFITDPAYPGQLFLLHLVTSTDDLVDLAVRCGSSPEAIRRYNRKVVFHHLDNVVGDKILIPVKNENVPPQKRSLTQGDDNSERMRMEAAAVHAFLLLVEDECSEEEAKFYLSEVNYDVRTALDAFTEDCAWTKGKPQRSS